MWRVTNFSAGDNKILWRNVVHNEQHNIASVTCWLVYENVESNDLTQMKTPDGSANALFYYKLGPLRNIEIRHHQFSRLIDFLRKHAILLLAQWMLIYTALSPDTKLFTIIIVCVQKIKISNL